MSKGFQYRLIGAKKFEDELFSVMGDIGFEWVMNGTEHTHPFFVDNLRNSTDQTSLAIRFQPDGVCAIGNIPRSFYLEAKSGNTIEKMAYEQYMKLHDAGNIVVVVFGGSDWKWNFIERIKLISGEDSVKQFPKHLQLPVSNSWICPRLLPKEKYLQWKSKNQQASGTPYRYVSKRSLLSFSTFKKQIISELRNISTTL